MQTLSCLQRMEKHARLRFRAARQTIRPLCSFVLFTLASVGSGPLRAICLAVPARSGPPAISERIHGPLCTASIFGIADSAVYWDDAPYFRVGLASVAERDSASRPETPKPPTAVVPVQSTPSQQPGLAANPGRPTMVVSALLTPLGYAQFETGVQYAARSAEFRRRFGMEETMRLTVAPRLQFIVSVEPVAFSHTYEENLTQRGDATAGLQVVAIKGNRAKPTISLSYLHLIHGGTATNLDICGYANSAVLLASLDLGRFHLDANGFMNETEGNVRRAQFGDATAVTLYLKPKLTAALELRYFTEPLTGGNTTSVLFATGYNLHPNLVFDLGIVRGMNDTSTRWQIMSGFTYLLPYKILEF